MQLARDLINFLLLFFYRSRRSSGQQGSSTPQPRILAPGGNDDTMLQYIINVAFSGISALG